ncbi:hypothetical protein J2X31_002068 [Flavobacterium arsenatis]|uniref:Uncharacterized protein n=1 Tax=Flavobacterium arsenatis TaxID=1484332 RepID=A0ABU1TQ27_9FLAO|nr:hypothetical protein [Flavobacterium arsenatis]MDR6968053.1 hypothetical protein [Flavobacterium arsenatis]
MKNIFYIVILLFYLNGYAQKYFPKLNNLFLQQSGSESLFSDDLNYFREGLLAANNKLFYKDLQTSNSRNAAFYSTSLIPRFITEVNFLETGMLLKFNAKSKDEFPSFPVIFNEFFDSNDGGKFGQGTIDIFDGGISLAFTDKQISTSSKKQNDEKPEFIVKKISYKINKDKLSIELDGNFKTDISIKKQKFAKDLLQKLKIEVVKQSFIVSCINPSNNKDILIIEFKSK